MVQVTRHCPDPFTNLGHGALAAGLAGLAGDGGEVGGMRVINTGLAPLSSMISHTPVILEWFVRFVTTRVVMIHTQSQRDSS